MAARDGDYADAMRKGNAVHLLLVEATGAISPALHLLLCALAAASKTPDIGRRLHLLRQEPRCDHQLLRAPHRRDLSRRRRRRLTYDPHRGAEP